MRSANFSVFTQPGRITDIGVNSPDGPTRAALGPTVCAPERPLRDELRKCERLLSALDARGGRHHVPDPRLPSRRAASEVVRGWHKPVMLDGATGPSEPEKTLLPPRL